MLPTVTSKGQITLPKGIRERLHLRAGDKVEFLVLEDGRVELIPVTAPVTRLKGMVPTPKKPVTLEEMDATIKNKLTEQPLSLNPVTRRSNRGGLTLSFFVNSSGCLKAPTAIRALWWRMWSDKSWEPLNCV